jgi:hypothetical protein
MVPFAKTYSFALGVFVGIAGFFWVAIGGFTSPVSQETARIEVLTAHLKPKDQWLEKVHFQLIPLDGVRSAHGYAILLMTPPPGGLSAGTNATTRLELTTQRDGGQPIEIESMDFGPNGDQPAIKFIDEMFRPNANNYYHQTQHLWIGSSQY